MQLIMVRCVRSVVSMGWCTVCWVWLGVEKKGSQEKFGPWTRKRRPNHQENNNTPTHPVRAAGLCRLLSERSSPRGQPTGAIRSEPIRAEARAGGSEGKHAGTRQGHKRMSPPSQAWPRCITSAEPRGVDHPLPPSAKGSQRTHPHTDTPTRHAPYTHTQTHRCVVGSIIIGDRCADSRTMANKVRGGSVRPCAGGGVRKPKRTVFRQMPRWSRHRNGVRLVI